MFVAKKATKTQQIKKNFFTSKSIEKVDMFCHPNHPHSSLKAKVIQNSILKNFQKIAKNRLFSLMILGRNRKTTNFDFLLQDKCRMVWGHTTSELVHYLGIKKVKKFFLKNF